VLLPQVGFGDVVPSNATEVVIAMMVEVVGVMFFGLVISSIRRVWNGWPYIVLCCAVLCCVKLCCVKLGCPVPCCIAMCGAAPCRALPGWGVCVQHWLRPS
jgi:hypothetical protein